MCSATGKRRNLHAFILFYFLFFTVSTLSYTPIYDQLNKDTDEHAEADIRIPRLFLLELIGSEITHHSGSGSPESALRFIILKKRAVLPTENLIRRNQAQDHGFSTYRITLNAGSTYAPLVRDKSSFQYVLLLLPFHSGISPPYA
ncbi:MAG TPA: hypothetical protein VJW95_02205 [Dissulfurispiraceae bacterium]|nr:hypothetical protein [Dissulfurispiraceae bacterium]